MSMREEFVKEYVRHQLATAVSAGIMRGTTEDAAGHDHKFAVMFNEIEKMFIGEAGFGGSGPHTHFIMASIKDVVESHLDNPPQPRTEEDIVVEVNKANSPANLRKVLDFYNLKEVRLTTSSGGLDGHTHGVVLRYAGKLIDKMGRPLDNKQNIPGASAHILEAMANAKQLDNDIAKAKLRRDEAMEELEKILLKAIRPSVIEQDGAKLPAGPDTAQMPAEEVAKPADTATLPTAKPDVEIQADDELKDEAGDVSSPQAVRDIDGAVDGTPKTVAEKMIEDIHKRAKNAEAELMARIKETMDAKKHHKK